MTLEEEGGASEVQPAAQPAPQGAQLAKTMMKGLAPGAGAFGARAPGFGGFGGRGQPGGFGQPAQPVFGFAQPAQLAAAGFGLAGAKAAGVKFGGAAAFGQAPAFGQGPGVFQQAPFAFGAAAAPANSQNPEPVETPAGVGVPAIVKSADACYHSTDGDTVHPGFTPKMMIRDRTRYCNNISH